jgi:hypothetical protein
MAYGTHRIHGKRYAEPLTPKVCHSGLRFGLIFRLFRVLIRPELFMRGIQIDAVSSVWASLRRKMVRGEGFEPPTNSV